MNYNHNQSDPRNILSQADANRAMAIAADTILKNFSYHDELKGDPKKGVFSFFSRYSNASRPTLSWTLTEGERKLFIQWLQDQRRKYNDAADELESKIGVKE